MPSPTYDIRAVIQWKNGMLMVFDQDGKQIPDLQGHVDEVGEKVAALFPRERWEHHTWRPGLGAFERAKDV